MRKLLEHLARNIYYYKNTDFLPYTVFRAINEKTTFEDPNIDFLSSNAF